MLMFKHKEHLTLWIYSHIFNICIKIVILMLKFYFKNYHTWPVSASIVITAQEALYLFWVVIKGLNGEKEIGGEETEIIFSTVMTIYHVVTCFEYESEWVHALRQIYG